MAVPMCLGRLTPGPHTASAEELGALPGSFPGSGFAGCRLGARIHLSLYFLQIGSRFRGCIRPELSPRARSEVVLCLS